MRAAALRGCSLLLALGALLPHAAQATPARDVITLADPSACASTMLAVDLTGDGRDELVIGCATDVAKATPPIYVYGREADGSFRRLETLRPPAGIGCSSVLAGDVDGDRRTDLVAECYAREEEDRGTWVYERSSDGSSFEAAVHLPQPDGTTGCGLTAVRDSDADGRDDVQLVCRTPASFQTLLATYRRVPQGAGFELPSTTRIDSLLGTGAADCTWLGFVDLDVDGTVDRFGACRDGVRVVIAGEGEVATVVPPANRLQECWYPRPMDVIGNEDLELVRSCATAAGSYAEVIRVQLGSASVSKVGASGPVAAAPAGSRRCAPSADVAALHAFGGVAKSLALGCSAYAEFGAGAIFQLRTRGEPTLRDLVRRVPLVGASCGTTLGAGDFDGDGRDDLAMSCRSSTRGPFGGDDRVTIALGATAMRATAGADLLVGTDAVDRLAGGRGNDTLRGAGGPDLLRGQDGSDLLDGGGGNDTLAGGGGRDTLQAGPGDDRLLARDGAADLVSCGAGRDVATVDRLDTVRGCEVVRRA